jgi:hypothetical protein
MRGLINGFAVVSVCCLISSAPGYAEDSDFFRSTLEGWTSPLQSHNDRQDREQKALKALGTGSSTWFGRNLATEESTRTVLKGVTPYAERYAPGAYKALKGPAAAAVLLGVIGGAGGYYLYEHYYVGEKPE